MNIRTRNLLLPVLLAILVIAAQSCSGPASVENDPPEVPLAVAEGDSVVTNADAALHSRPNQPTGETVPEDTKGEVTRANSSWAQVDFENGQFGVVEKSFLDVIGGTDPPIDPPPTGGDYQLLIVGCSNFRQINQGAGDFGFDTGGPDPRMSGNAIQSYGDPESSFYNEGVSIVRDFVAANPGADGIAIGLCHRYAQEEGLVLEGARSFDVVEMLDAPYSGSPRYSEIEIMRNIGEMLDAEAPGLDHFLIPLHRYIPENNCARKLGTNTPLALELLTDEAVSRGYVSPLVLNGQPFRIGPIENAAGHISGDMCHLTTGGVDWIWSKPGGLAEMISALDD